MNSNDLSVVLNSIDISLKSIAVSLGNDSNSIKFIVPSILSLFAVIVSVSMLFFETLKHKSKIKINYTHTIISGTSSLVVETMKIVVTNMSYRPTAIVKIEKRDKNYLTPGPYDILLDSAERIGDVELPMPLNSWEIKTFSFKLFPHDRFDIVLTDIDAKSYVIDFKNRKIIYTKKKFVRGGVFNKIRKKIHRLRHGNHLC